MINLREITVMEPTSITCDRCGRNIKNEPDNFEFAECPVYQTHLWLRIDHRGWSHLRG